MMFVASFFLVSLDDGSAAPGLLLHPLVGFLSGSYFHVLLRGGGRRRSAGTVRAGAPGRGPSCSGSNWHHSQHQYFPGSLVSFRPASLPQLILVLLIIRLGQAFATPGALP